MAAARWRKSQSGDRTADNVHDNLNEQEGARRPGGAGLHQAQRKTQAGGLGKSPNFATAVRRVYPKIPVSQFPPRFS